MSDTTTPPGTDEAPKAAPEPTADELFEARMKEWKTRWGTMRTEFEQELDELKLKAHLGREDAKDEWDRIETRFRAFSKDARREERRRRGHRRGEAQAHRRRAEGRFRAAAEALLAAHPARTLPRRMPIP